MKPAKKNLSWMDLSDSLEDYYALEIPLPENEMLRVEIRDGHVYVDRYLFQDKIVGMNKPPETIAEFEIGEEQ